MSTSLDTFKNLLERARPSIQEIIPRGTIEPERFFKMALVAATKQPDLALCETKSLLLALVDAAALGLDCSGLLGEAFIVPYLNRKTGRRNAQLVIGYRGYINLASRDGLLKDIQAHCVYRKDKFFISYGIEPKLVHEPNFLEAQKDDDIIGAYAVAWLHTGATHFMFLPRTKIDAIKARSAAQAGPWVTDYAEMAKKTAIRALFKLIYIPTGSNTGKAIAIEEAREFSPEIPVTPAADIALPEFQEPEPVKKSERIAKELKKVRKHELEDEEPPPPDEPPPEMVDATDAPPALDDADLTAALRKANLLHVVEAKRKELLSKGQNWESWYGDLVAMPVDEAVKLIRALSTMADRAPSQSNLF